MDFFCDSFSPILTLVLWWIFYWESLMNSFQQRQCTMLFNSSFLWKKIMNWNEAVGACSEYAGLLGMDRVNKFWLWVGLVWLQFFRKFGFCLHNISPPNDCLFQVGFWPHPSWNLLVNLHVKGILRSEMYVMSNNFISLDLVHLFTQSLIPSKVH